MNDKNIDEAMSPRAAEVNPAIRAAEAPAPSKLTEEEYLQRRFAEATSPRAAEYNPTMRAASPDEGIHRSR